MGQPGKGFRGDKISLNGTWKFELLPGRDEQLIKGPPAGDFQFPTFLDAHWHSIQVPGDWENQGFGQPNLLRPTEAVGCYRRQFTVHEAWRGRVIRLRFEGVNNAAQVWVNGQEVGHRESGGTGFEFDVTPLLRFEAENLIAVQVSSLRRSSNNEIDVNSYPEGIWRDVYLYSLPLTRIEDFWIWTDLDPVYVDAVVRAELKLRTTEMTSPSNVRVDGFLYDAEGKEILLKGFHAEPTFAENGPVLVMMASPVKNPRKWTAETPYLYSLVIRLQQAGKIVQEFETRIGFRQVEVVGMTLRVNGVPIEIRGVATTPPNGTSTGKNWDSSWVQEIRLLKEANINAIRSRRLPLEENFLNLCDQYGIYVISDIPNVWALGKYSPPSADEPASRARAILDQYKNHPSVILWHLEHPSPPIRPVPGEDRAISWLRENDPTRPVAISSNRANSKEIGNGVTDLHYDPMSHVEFKEIYPTPVLFGEYHAVPEEVGRLKDEGFVESWGKSLQLEWERFRDRSYFVVGGFLCCWNESPVKGNLRLHQRGILDSQRQAKPVYPYIRSAYAPVLLSLRNPSFIAGRLNATLRVINKFNFTNLDGFTFQWELTKEGKVVSSGHERYRVSPRSTSFFPLSFSTREGADHILLSVWDPAGHRIVDKDFPLPSALSSSSIEELLKKAGVQTTAAVAISAGTNIVVQEAYQASWGTDGPLLIQDQSGNELLAINGVTMQPEKSSWTTMQVEPIQYLPTQYGTRFLSIPFTIKGSLIDKSKEWLISGAIRVEFGQSWVRITYSFNSDRECVIPEAGLRLKLSSLLTQLSWNRDALNLVGPKERGESSLKQHVPLSVLQSAMSKRKLYWLSLEGESTTLLLIPVGSLTNLRIGDSSNELVMSDFLSAGNFLGKADKETAEKKLTAREEFSGGFVIHFLSKQQRTRFSQLSASEKDLTWSRRVAEYFTLTDGQYGGNGG
jgi:hypothetical protein